MIAFAQLHVWVCRTLSPAVLAAMLLAPAAMAQSHIMQWYDEDAYCNGTKASVPAPPVPVERKMARHPKRAIATDGFTAVKLTIDEDGNVSATEILEETPQRGFGDAVAKAAKDGWRFEPGRPGYYCLNVTFEVLRGSDPPKPPWDHPNLPTAPKPVQAIPEPIVPPDVWEQGLGCRVELNIRIDDDGAVVGTSVLSEAPAELGCGKAVELAVMEWLFSPETAPGRYRLVVNAVP